MLEKTAQNFSVRLKLFYGGFFRRAVIYVTMKPDTALTLKRIETQDQKERRENMGEKKVGKVRILQGAVMMAAAALLLVTAAPFMMRKLGTAGLFLGEMMFLLPAVLVPLVCRWNLRETFSISMPSAGASVGAILMWIGVTRIMNVIVLTTAMLFPKLYYSQNFEQSARLAESHWLLLIIALAVAPALAEEALFRGAFMSSLRPLKKKWAVILISGILFGLFHGSPLQFAALSVMGIMLGYVMAETRNLFYVILIHFVNNLIAAIQTIAMGDLYKYIGAYTEYSDVPAATYMEVGISCLSAVIAPACIYIGNYLLHSRTQGYRQKLLPDGRPDIVISLVAGSAGIFVWGIYLLVLGVAAVFMN